MLRYTGIFCLFAALQCIEMHDICAFAGKRYLWMNSGVIGLHNDMLPVLHLAMADIESMHCNKPSITYLSTSIAKITPAVYWGHILAILAIIH